MVVDEQEISSKTESEFRRWRRQTSPKIFLTIILLFDIIFAFYLILHGEIRTSENVGVLFLVIIIIDFFIYIFYKGIFIGYYRKIFYKKTYNRIYSQLREKDNERTEVLRDKRQEAKKRAEKDKKMEKEKLNEIKNLILQRKKKGFQKVSIIKLAKIKKISSSKMLDIVRNLLNKKEILGIIDEQNKVFIFNDKTVDYPCPNCKKNVKSHWIVCPNCQAELE